MNALLVTQLILESRRLDGIAGALEHAAHMTANKRPEWWRWTCWLALAITLRRIGAR